ncbi:MAG: hypothetical protein KVP17_003408 [Porospora cf. gigantea B]|uniref:uncharacterized protein n=1 Tax=Porospora cf. gigantea B TaxID=2853592 RepID=UPI0035717BAF|nr:MAG: hypothetical protein KVP17_003408 [Porospora cf. gigantea B]
MPRLNLFAKKQKLKQQGGSGSSEQSEERVVRRTGTAGIFSKPYYDFKGRPAPSTAETASKTDLSSPRPPDVSVRRFSSIRVPTPVLVEGTTRTERYTGSQRHVGDFQGETYVVSQHVKKHRVRRPKRIVREEIVEKVVVVPERFVKEEIVESSDEVSELIVERVTPIVQKYEIEVPEIRYVDKVVEVPEVVVEEKVVYVPKKVVEEVQVTVPKIIIEEKIVEVPEIIYNEYDVEKVVEVPQVIQKEVEIPVPVPQYVDKPYPVQVDIDQPVAVPRNIPLPLEHILTYEYHLPRYNVIKDQIPFNVYLPKFVEVPVPALQADRFFAERAEWVSAHIEAVMGQQSSLCEIENTVEEAKQLQQQQARGLRESVDFVTALRAGWLKIEDDSGREIPNPHVSENGMTQYLGQPAQLAVSSSLRPLTTNTSTTRNFLLPPHTTPRSSLNASMNSILPSTYTVPRSSLHAPLTPALPMRTVSRSSLNTYTVPRASVNTSRVSLPSTSYATPQTPLNAIQKIPLPSALQSRRSSPSPRNSVLASRSQAVTRTSLKGIPTTTNYLLPTTSQSLSSRYSLSTPPSQAVPRISLTPSRD